MNHPHAPAWNAARRTWLWAGAALVLWASLAGAQSVLEVRGGTQQLTGTLVSVDAGGLRFRPGSGIESVWSWDRVRRVTGEGAERAQAYAALGEALALTRDRLARGDIGRAERGLDELGPVAALETSAPGPTSALMAECRLRLSLARGQRGKAVLAWIARLRTGNSPAWRGGGVEGTPILDPGTGLCVLLPPVFEASIDGAGLGTLADAPVMTLSGTDRASLIASLYRASLREAGGLDPGPIAPPQGPLAEDPGVALVWAVVSGRLGDAPQRAAARKYLRSRLASLERAPSDDPARWIIVWCRLGMGRSLLSEPDPALRRAGLVELLHVPARFAHQHPHLARVALLEVINELQRTGERAGAAALQGELARLSTQPMGPGVDEPETQTGASGTINEQPGEPTPAGSEP